MTTSKVFQKKSFAYKIFINYLKDAESCFKIIFNNFFFSNFKIYLTQLYQKYLYYYDN